MEHLNQLITEAWFDKFIKWSKNLYKKPRVAAAANKLSPARVAALEVIGRVLETPNTKRWLRSQSITQLEKLKAGISNGTIDANYITRMSEKYVAGANTAFYYRNTFYVYNNNWYKMIQGMSSIQNIADVTFSHYAVLAAAPVKQGGVNTLIPNFSKLRADKKLQLWANQTIDTVGKGEQLITKTSVVAFTDINTANQIANELNQQLKNTAIGKKYPDSRVIVVTENSSKKVSNPNFKPGLGDQTGNRRYRMDKVPYYVIKLPIFDVRAAID
jgi:hypothetical protein